MKRTHRKPSFFWQGVLILVPAIVLTALGAGVLIQDKRSVEREAKSRAEEIGDQAAQLLFNELTNVAHATVSFQVDRNGRLATPKPYEVSPLAVPLDLSALSAEQRDLWDAASRREHGVTNREEAIELYDQFLATDLPERFRAHALFAHGMLLLAQGKLESARTNFAAVLKLNDTSGETGIDLKALAAIKLNAHSPTSLASNAVAHPTALTSEILRQAATSERAANVNSSSNSVAQWRETWEHDEMARALYAKLRPTFKTNVEPGVSSNALSFPVSRTIDPPLLATAKLEGGRPYTNTHAYRLRWEKTGRRTSGPRVILEGRPPVIQHGGFDGQWIVSRGVSAETWTMIAITEDAARELLANAIDSLSLPSYFDLSVRVAGYDLISSNTLTGMEYVRSGKGSGNYWKRAVLAGSPPALATAVRGDPNDPALAVAVHLTSRGYLFDEQRSRAIFFTLLLVAAMLASAIGFAGAYRAFRKQLRLSEMKSNFVSSVSHELR
ncbi:MAG TPA: hypothetical protein VK530_08510, partial [Candidatus Acidoferrum sp.]|nr:hypothetical protein [Candidatus Acidoferrum sp.]